MKRIFFSLALVALTAGLLGSCKTMPVPVTGVTLEASELIIVVGGSDIKLSATIIPENASVKDVIWSSDKPEVATIDNQGNVHAIADGSAIITVTTKDGGKTASCAIIVKSGLPAGALPGEFSVSSSKKVYFSKGNLWYGKLGGAAEATGPTWNFETNQYDYPDRFDANHVNHFYWSKNASVGYAITYSDSGTSGIDVLFTNAALETAKPDFKVNNVTGKYRTLSTTEWRVLLSKNKNKYGVTVCGKPNCLILAPDTFKGTIAASYDAASWALAEAAGLVCLPAAGSRSNEYISMENIAAQYWSSTANGWDSAYMVQAINSGITPDGDAFRRNGFCIRLVTESK